MNCQGFESIINDLARDQVMDAAIKTGALAHSKDCARCAARLAEERMLSAGLRRLAASEADDEAPRRVEQLLCAAFLERNSQVAPQVVATTRSRAWRWAVAASIAAILALVALVALRSETASPPEQAKSQDQPSPQATPAPPFELRPDAPGAKDQATVNRAKQRPAPKNRTGRSAQIAKGNSRNEKSAAQTSATGPLAAANEIATDFIPLMQGESLNQMDGGQVVRVELPRTALMSFGLPMNMERADERIKADVVIGNDGLARAIRFVR
jgi:hypothetical protein